MVKERLVAIFLKADSHIVDRVHAAPLIHACHAAPLPCSDSAVSFVQVRMVARNIRTASPNSLTGRLFCSVLLPLFSLSMTNIVHCLVSHWPPASEIGMLLTTTFVELHVIAGRSRTQAGSPQAVSRQTCCALALRRTTWSEHGMGMGQQM